MANDLQSKIFSMVGHINRHQGMIDGIQDAVTVLRNGIATHIEEQGVYVTSLFGLIHELIVEAAQNYNNSDGSFIVNPPSNFELEFNGLVKKFVSGIPVIACDLVVIIPVTSIKMKSGEEIKKNEIALMAGNQFFELNRIIAVYIERVLQQNGIDQNLFSFTVMEKLSL